MNRILLSAATTAIVTLVLTGALTRTASATDARTQFLNMRTAVLAAVPKPPKVTDGAGSKIQYGQTMNLTVSANADGTVTAWAVVDGKMVETSAVHFQEVSGGGSGSRTFTASASDSMSVDLDAQKYQSIAFGMKPNTLVLAPKAKTNQRYVVSYDPKSNMPSKVQLESSKDGKWTVTRASKVSFGSSK